MHDTKGAQRKKISTAGQRRLKKIDSSVVYETIKLCQPDRRKSCTACCGLFNFIDISREHLERFLADGAARSSLCVAEKDIEDRGDTAEVRDQTSYICPHQGLIYNIRPGCLLHPHYRNSTLRNEGFFGESICNGFTCPAHTILTGEEKRIIIDLLDNWYLYTVAIIDPFFTSWLITYINETHPSLFLRYETLKPLLDECFMIHATHLARRKGPLFFYSLSEYKHEYSITLDGAEEAEIKEIIAP